MFVLVLKTFHLIWSAVVHEKLRSPVMYVATEAGYLPFFARQLGRGRDKMKTLVVMGI